MTTWQPALHIPGLFASFSDDQLPPVPTASVRHRTQQGDHREGRFRWHLLASVLITAVVLIVVGIVFTQTKEAALALWTWIFVVLILLVGIGVPLRVLLRNPRPAS